MNKENQRSSICKRLREETGAPLRLCLKAYENKEGNYEAALEWIKKEMISSDFGSAKEFFRSFILKAEGKLIYGQIMGSDTLIRIEEVSQAISKNGQDKESLEKSLKKVSLAAKETVCLKSWESREDLDLHFYLHLKLDENSSTGGAVIWKGRESQGEEIHWAYAVSGKKGSLRSLSSKEEILENRKNLLSIEGDRNNDPFFKGVEEVLILD